MATPSVILGAGFVGAVPQSMMSFNQTIQPVVEKKTKTGTIKPSHRGAFTAKAKKAGLSVPAMANKALKPGSKASAVTKKQAVFAKNAQKW